jgi:hypothetical protein
MDNMFPQKKKKGIGVSIAVGDGDGEMPPKYKASGGSGGSGSPDGVETTPKPPAAPASETSRENNAQESPSTEAAFHSGGGSPVATPESVNYRTAAETCARCEYMQGAQCLFLQQPVAAGDSCNRFEDKGEDMQMGGGMDSGGGGGGMGRMAESDMNAGGY